VYVSARSPRQCRPHLIPTNEQIRRATTLPVPEDEELFIKHLANTPGRQAMRPELVRVLVVEGLDADR
jgi:hypothetical protein